MVQLNDASGKNLTDYLILLMKFAFAANPEGLAKMVLDLFVV
jgi:hypothetical protein